MPNDLMISSVTSRPVSLYSASNEYLDAVLNGRCDQARLIANLRDLLSLYYQPAETPDMRARQIALFVKDLADMSEDAVGFAIDEWRRKQDRRPTPATLRQLCMVRRQEAINAITAQSPQRYTPPTLPNYDLSPLDPAEKARRQAVIESCAKAAGFVKHKGRYVPQRLLDEDEARRRAAGRHWSETAAPDDPRWAELRRAREKARKETI